MKLVIVESPTKAKTISKFLGKEYDVQSSFGHIRDLPKSKLGVDVEKNFEPTYIVPTKAKKNLTALKHKAEKADAVILASDEDREGEAIAWHLAQALGLGNGENAKGKERTVERIVFHEITKTVIEEALKHPRQIDENMVNAQQARRILDRLVGYKLSPFLWKKVMRGLSAGRVQSVAVRLIVDRENEIKSFKPEEYWTVSALLESNSKSFEANLTKINDKKVERFDIKNKSEADKILNDLRKEKFQVSDIEQKETKRNPLAPFTTSTLQQASFSKYKYSAKQTMMLAQQLYEGIEIGEHGHTGLITYMRTDSVNLSAESLAAAKNWLTENLGKNYSLEEPKKYTTKSKGAQEAHEAIRPSDVSRTPELLKGFLDPKQLKLYELIWQRFVASQMPPAIFESITADINAGDYTLEAKGTTLKFDGYLKIYPTQFEESHLPPLKKDEVLSLQDVKADQHFTEPPPRFNEASLVKALEEHGIGRPSTYAPIISTIQDRGYVQKDEQKRFIPTEVGGIVTDLLVKHFPQIVDIEFTAKIEEGLDDIAENKIEWQKVLADFYFPFEKNLKEKEETVEKKNFEEKTDEVCEKCGKPMIIKMGRFGKFLACSGFPECKNAKSLKSGPTNTGVKCPKCFQGEILQRKTRKGKMFFSCSRYPECDFALWNKPTGEKCPQCDSLLVIAGKNKIKCSNKECKFSKDAPEE